MNFTTITLEGNLLPAEILEKIASGEAKGQQPTDFGLEKSRRLSDEIAAAWSDARAYWDAFRRSQRRLPESDPATTVTREQWMLPLLRTLGYELTYQPAAAVVGGLTYALSHRAGSVEEAPPVHIIGARHSLDERAALRPRLSAHALVQSYLNSTEHLWGLVSNGRQLRLLRDSSRTSRPSYVEFDLEAMLEGEKFAEFAILYRLLHRSRLPQTTEDAPRSLLEQYHQEAIAAGGRVREGLRAGVEQVLREVGQALLAHPANEALRAKLAQGTLTPLEYYRQLLRLVYRLLFLMVAEERGLMGGTEEGRQRYLAWYSVTRLRQMAERPALGQQARHTDLWLGLLATFRALEDETGATALGVTALDGDLFGERAMPDLEGTRLSNAALRAAIRALSLYRDPETNVLRRVNYGALDVEELGSVYESLLDYRPVLRTQNSMWHFDLVAGTERKTTGSYYTRPELVQELIKSALEPVLVARLQAAGREAEAQARALLEIKVCDPACGSGHFLLAAARRLAQELARVRSGEEQPAPEAFRRAVREVIAHCIYGVDLNPLAVDLCKLALWIEGHNAGMPLSFLDSHIRWGNSLVGATRELVDAGIPDDAYKAVTGDDKKVASALKARNKKERKALESGQLMFDIFASARLDGVAEAARRLDAAPDDTVGAVRAKAAAYEALHRPGSELWDEKTLHHLWTAAFFMLFDEKTGPFVPTTADLVRYVQTHSTDPRMAAEALALATRLGFFHWHLEFPQVFGADGSGGFDVVLGNPPWERIKLQEQEHWVDDPYIAQAANKAERDRRLAEYQRSSDPAIQARVEHFEEAKHDAEAASRFIRASGRFPLTAVGDVNTYAIFAEHDRNLLDATGRTGIIVPTGIATDFTTQAFFNDLIGQQRLIQLIGFENEAFIFQGVHNQFKFCALTIGGHQEKTEEARFVFFCRYFDHLQEEERFFKLTYRDLLLLNPNTATVPVFRTRTDAELTKKIYTQIPVLENERQGESLWGVSFLRMLDMANDSHLFRTRTQLESMNYALTGNIFENGAEIFLPLYEAKMIWQFDHRFASLIGKENADDRPSRKYEGWYGVHAENPDDLVIPNYWVSSHEVEARLSDYWNHDWLLSFRDVTSVINERTGIFSLLPRVGVNHKAPLIMFETSPSVCSVACLLVTLNSLIFDFITRQKMGGMSLSYFILKQLPVLPLDAFSAEDIAFISERVLELTYTAWDMQPFAEDLWAELDEAGRGRILARHAECNRDAPAHLFAPRDGFPLPPFQWNEERRALARAELDARIARLYGLTRDELRYILDPADVYGDDFPGETFRVLKEKEQRQFGEYRTRRLVLEAWDREEGQKEQG